MSDPRRRVARVAESDIERSAAPSTPSVGNGDWPAHPWVALVERFSRDAGRVEGVDAYHVSVVWWPTAAGCQPVLLVRRVRLD